MWESVQVLGVVKTVIESVVKKHIDVRVVVPPIKFLLSSTSSVSRREFLMYLIDPAFYGDVFN